MKRQWKNMIALLLSMLLLVTGCGVSVNIDTADDGSAYDAGSAVVLDEGSAQQEDASPTEEIDAETHATASTVEEDSTYTSKEEVAAYLYAYGHLPENFITKKEAKKLGWESSKGNLGEVAPGMSIGGDYFGNYEGVLPDGEYHECDIDSTGGYRGAKRIVYSTDGRIYYTEDHYSTFELLYGEE